MQEVGTGLGIEIRLAANPLGGLVEQFAQRDLGVSGHLGIRGTQHLAQESRHGLRSLALSLGVGAQDRHADAEGEEADQSHRGDRHSEDVATDELPEMVERRRGASAHGQTVQVALDIVGELLDRRVSTLRVELLRLERDAVDIAIQSSDLGGTARELGGERQDRLGAQGIGRCGEMLRQVAGDQEVEKSAERVHVAHRGHRSADELLRAGVRWGHQPRADVSHGDGIRVEHLGDAEV